MLPYLVVVCVVSSGCCVTKVRRDNCWKWQVPNCRVGCSCICMLSGSPTFKKKTNVLFGLLLGHCWKKDAGIDGKTGTRDGERPESDGGCPD